MGYDERSRESSLDCPPLPGKLPLRRLSTSTATRNSKTLQGSQKGASLQRANSTSSRRRAGLTPRLKQRATDESDSPTGSARGSVCSSSLFDVYSNFDDDEADSDCCPDNVKVLVRIRPATEKEAQEGTCVVAVGSKGISLQQPGHEAQMWAFDYVAGECVAQEELFQAAGQPLVENCLAGYNSSIFAYGQTGAGKTHTMQGSLSEHSQRGLSPRVFEWLFKRIAEEESAMGRELSYTCKCSFLEIYNESITDLLMPGSTNLQLREDVSRGCFVEGLSEETILNARKVHITQASLL